MMREVNQVPQGSMLTGKSQAQTEAVEALTALGYSPSEALRAVKAVLQETPDLDVEALLKATLKKCSKKKPTSGMLPAAGTKAPCFFRLLQRDQR